MSSGWLWSLLMFCLAQIRYDQAGNFLSIMVVKDSCITWPLRMATNINTVCVYTFPGYSLHINQQYSYGDCSQGEMGRSCSQNGGRYINNRIIYAVGRLHTITNGQEARTSWQALALNGLLSHRTICVVGKISLNNKWT